MTIHYKYGGSTASRTLACPSWVDAAAKAPEQRASAFAEEGTMLHELAEQILLGDDPSLDHLDQEQVGRLNAAIDGWDDICREYKISDFDPEETIEITPDVGGTCDIVGWSLPDDVVIADFKFGQGIVVKAVGNSQLLFYAMLVEHKRGRPFNSLTCSIIQPIPSRDGHDTVSNWEVPLEMYELFKKNFWAAIQKKGLRAGGHCQWCPAAPYCIEKTGQATAALIASKDATAALADNLAKALELETWIAEVKKEAHSQIELGNKITGYKLVDKRATRRWSDEAAAEVMMRGIKKLKVSDMQTSKLISPAQAEKIFKKKGIDFDKLDAYIKSVSSGTTLAREDDSRPETISAAAMQAALDRIS